jgi:hypothetical protein
VSDDVFNSAAQLRHGGDRKMLGHRGQLTGRELALLYNDFGDNLLQYDVPRTDVDPDPEHAEHDKQLAELRQLRHVPSGRERELHHPGRVSEAVCGFDVQGMLSDLIRRPART